MESPHISPTISSDHPKNSPGVLLSTTFHPGAQNVPADLIFSSQDSVYFYIHSHIFSGAAEHAFKSLLSAPILDTHHQTIIQVPESSHVLNMIFHVLYNMSCLQHSPSFDTVKTTVDRISIYGLNPKDYMVASSTLHELLLHFMPYHPLEVYAIAGHNDVYDIAKATSSHLLSFPLHTITDEMATRIGAVYLKRLLCLHADRSSALKYTVMLPPAFHTPSRTCSYNDQGKLSRAWVLAAAYLVWDSQPSLSAHSLEAALRPLQDLLTCPECRQIFSTRVESAVQEWSSVKYTI